MLEQTGDLQQNKFCILCLMIYLQLHLTNHVLMPMETRVSMERDMFWENVMHLACALMANLCVQWQIASHL